MNPIMHDSKLMANSNPAKEISGDKFIGKKPHYEPLNLPPLTIDVAHDGPQESPEYKIFYGHICFNTKNPKGMVFRDYCTLLCSVCKPDKRGIDIAYFNKSDLPYIRQTIENFRVDGYSND